MGTVPTASPLDSLRTGVNSLSDHPALSLTAVHDLMDTSPLGSPGWSLALAADDLRDALSAMRRTLADATDDRAGE